MLFNSIPFIFLFVPVTVSIFFLLGRVSRALALLFLTFASLVFYAQTNINTFMSSSPRSSSTT